MLRFENKPDEVFTQIVTDSLDMAIDMIEHAIELKEEERFVYFYFEEPFVKSFGGVNDGTKMILNELRKLKRAHVSDDIYMPTDIHFKILDRLLWNYCDLYNEELRFSDDSALQCNGETIQTLTHYRILDYFFWDTDYDFDEKTACFLLENKFVREQVGSSIQALNTAVGKLVDFSDLKLEKTDRFSWDDSDEGDYSGLWLDQEIEELD